MCYLLCREKWEALLDQVNARDQKLFGAGEIHRFNRDVEDALSRIQEKYASIPEDRGRDLKAAQSYMKKHEGFENELVALEAQVKQQAPEIRTVACVVALVWIWRNFVMFN